MKKRLLAVLLGMSVICGTFAGCGKAPEAASEESSTESAASAVSAEEQTVEFTYLTRMWEPFSAEVNLISEFEKATNTKITFEYAPTENYATRINTCLADGDLPDVIQVADAAQLNTLIDEGAVIPLEDLLKEYGQNIIETIGEENFQIGRAADGHIYSIPFLSTITGTKGWIVRQDWLDSLEIEEPTTWDEFVSMLKAFRDQDANANGNTSGEIPLSGDIAPLAMTFGIEANGVFCLDDDGNYTLIYEHPNYGEYLSQMQMLYTEGLLDAEYLDRSGDANESNLTAAMSNDLVGVCYTFLNNIKVIGEANPDIEYVSLAPPEGPDGDAGIPGAAAGIGTNAAVITIGGEDKAIGIIKFFDWMFSPEGQRMSSYGVEGVHYDLVNDAPVLREEYALNFNVYRGAGMNFQPISHVWLTDAYLQVLVAGKSTDEMDSVTRNVYEGIRSNSEQYCVTLPPLYQTEAYTEYYDLLQEVQDAASNTIVGNMTVDEFFEEYENLKAEGLAQVIQEGNEAYSASVG